MTDDERDNTFDAGAFVHDPSLDQDSEPELTRTGMAVIAVAGVAVVALGVALHRDWIAIVLGLAIFVVLPMVLRKRRVRARRRRRRPLTKT